MKPGLHQTFLRTMHAGIARKELQLLLKQHKRVRENGTEAVAELIHVEKYHNYTPGMQQVLLWLKIKVADGNYRYTHSYSLLKEQDRLLIPGRLFFILYIPGDLSVIVILQSMSDCGWQR